ncbi:hypothetical protein Patl1_04209 [Pistacia atlantica]|uniref:Uncharacterized protein n=1 Tax=Pistacia atlantica TaxID=434234 RepID=A0ACC1BU46_9ROSI|nr:hypothetical protein Patl1_04209 [Pistacia atlantica]
MYAIMQILLNLSCKCQAFAFCDSSLPYAVRVKDLVSRMTLAEKVKQLGPMATGVPRVVPSATMFPAVILTTASFNESLWKKIGEAISTEARAMYNLGRIGLTFWSPNVNIDVKGHKKYKDLNSRPLKVSSCCKHYVAYDLENWTGGDRLNFDSRVTEQDMVETFQRPFEMCVKEGDASSIMCSYNSVNGTPSCADPKLLNQTVRGKWDLHGCRYGMWYVLHQLHNKCSATREGYPCQYTSPIAGFSAYANVTYQKGCRHISCKNGSLIFPAVEASKTADATIILAGLGLSIEDEKLDRENLLLPGYQTELINQPSYGLAILDKDGGQAIADVVFGKYNPGGRLPITWYEADYVNKLPVTSMPLRPIPNLGYPGRTYKFFDGSTVYPFGYGLSYTQFKYNITSSNCSLSIKLDKFQPCRNINYINGTQKPQCPATLVDDLKCEEFIQFQMAVQNVGNVDGSEVILVYSKPPNGIAGTHIKQVIGFQRVFVEAGQTKMVNFAVNACKSLRIVDKAANILLPSGQHTIIVGDSGLSFPFNVNFSHLKACNITIFRLYGQDHLSSP